jgi:hypothetical protein
VGIIQNLLVTCKLHGVNPYDYLVDVLQRVGSHRASRVEGLRSKHRHKLLAAFGKVNAVFVRNTLNRFDEYEKITESDLKEIIKIVSSLAPPRLK